MVFSNHTMKLTMADKKKAESGDKVCVNCGKKIMPGTEYIKQGGVYCCEKCCHIGQKRPNVCEFC